MNKNVSPRQIIMTCLDESIKIKSLHGYKTKHVFIMSSTEPKKKRILVLETPFYIK